MKRVLTVKGSGCVALGYSAKRLLEVPSARIGSPRKMTGARRTRLRTAPAPNVPWAKWPLGQVFPGPSVPWTKCSLDYGCKNMVPRTQATLMPFRSRTAGASRTTPVPAVERAAGTVSRHAVSKRRKSRQRRALLPATVWSSCSRRKSSREKTSQGKPRLDRVGTATFPRSPAIRSTPTAALVVPDPSHSPIIGQAPVSRRRCGAEQTARRPS